MPAKKRRRSPINRKPESKSRTQSRKTNTVEDRTEERRQRVLELFGKRDRRIALILIGEKFFDPGEIETDSEEWDRFVDACRRVVGYDREAIREEWKKLKKKPTNDPVAINEFIARLDTRIDDLDRIIDSGAAKAGTKVNALGEVRQFESLKAKVSGLDIDGKEAQPADDPGDRPFVGLVMDFGKVSPDAKKRIDDWLKRTSSD